MSSTLQNLHRKRILLIAPKYYGYGRMIQEKLEENGAEVFWIYQGIYEINAVYSALYKYTKRISEYICKSYYHREINRLPQKIDYVLVIKGHSLTGSIMESMKRKFPDSKFIMYQWDSAINEKNALILEKYFDKVFTFDRSDAEQYSWIYRPLFFDQNLCKVTEKTIDLTYIATIHTQRVRILHEIEKLAQEKGYKLFSYLVCTGLGYIKRKYIMHDPVYSGLCRKEVNFQGMSIEDTQNIFDKTKIVVDYTNPYQTGLTMRTIESFGHKCKLVTNNKQIKNERFYNEENILIYEEAIEIPDEFVQQSYHEPTEDNYFYYSLNGWLNTIFDEEVKELNG